MAEMVETVGERSSRTPVDVAEPMARAGGAPDVMGALLPQCQRVDTGTSARQKCVYYTM